MYLILFIYFSTVTNCIEFFVPGTYARAEHAHVFSSLTPINADACQSKSNSNRIFRVS